MEPFTLGALAVLAYSLLKKPGSPPSSVGVSGPIPNSNAPASLVGPNSTETAQNAIGQALGALPVVGSAVATGFATGGKLDIAINPNSNTFSQTVAGVGLAGTLALAALAPILISVGVAASVAFWPVAIFLGIAVLTYAIVVVIQDLIRLGYGQHGARKDFLKQFSDIYNSASQQLLANPNQTYSPTQVERQIQPFVEGFMARLNLSAYQGILAKKGVIASGVLADYQFSSKSGVPFILKGDVFPGTNVQVNDDLLWHVNWYVDRGYLIANCQGCRDFDNPPDFNIGLFGIMGWEKSRQNDWVRSHCPPEEIQQIQVPDPILLNSTTAQIPGVQSTGYGGSQDYINVVPSAPPPPPASIVGATITPVVSAPEPAPTPPPPAPFTIPGVHIG